jgi:hypothetical protein
MMQILLLLGFILVYLLVLWLGAIAFEMTGLERRKARFQSLSAMTGTGFTTTEAEAIVNHPARRRIATWLIFIGNAGVVGAIVSIVLYVRSGLATPPWQQFGILGGVLLVLILLIVLRVFDRLTGVIIRRYRTGKPGQFLAAEEVLYEIGGYGLARLTTRSEQLSDAVTIESTGLPARNVSVLGILRNGVLIDRPEAATLLQADDQVFCFGRTGDITLV